MSPSDNVHTERFSEESPFARASFARQARPPSLCSSSERCGTTGRNHQGSLSAPPPTKASTTMRLVLLVPVLVLACESDLDCSLNGVCTAGSCVCDRPWLQTGAMPDCSLLDVLPSPTTDCGPGCVFHGDLGGSWCVLFCNNTSSRFRSNIRDRRSVGRGHKLDELGRERHR